MLSILVCHSYFLRFDRKQRERAKPYPPLATLQVAALLRQQGHAVSLFDAMLADGVAEFGRRVRAVRPQLVVLYEDNYNFLSKMCLGKMRRAGCEMICMARRAGARVIASGSDASDAPEPYLRAGADAVLHGEGLPALGKLVMRLDAAPSIPCAQLIEGVAGVATLSRGALLRSSTTPLPRHAPQPPAPAWDLVDMERYRDVWRAAHGYFSLNMAASRGCSFRCNWCAKPIWGNQYLQRAPADVAHEMAHLKRTFGPDQIWFADDIFGFRVDWVEQFAAATRAIAGSIPFTIQTRADLVSAKMADALREAGCREAWIGAESGSQQVLDAMNKGVTVGEVIAARARLRAADIRVGFFIQLGYIGEQWEDILATRDLIEIAQPDDLGVSVSYPLPGTRFHELVKEQLGVKDRWLESNDLAMMFQGTYRSELYRAVRDLLHAQVELDADDPARAALALRWQDLQGSAQRFRNVNHGDPVASRPIGRLSTDGVGP
jgi:anaerobic magnesium-protoporphyrin IX monomethyl ester cyclase